MFQAAIEPRIRTAPAVDRRFAFTGKPIQFAAAMDICRQRAPAPVDCDVLRFAAEARKSASRHAFQPAFSTDEWRTFSSYCVARRLPAGTRVLIPGRADRTLRFVVEGSLWQESAAAPSLPSHLKLLMPGTILGEAALFSDAPGDLDIHTFEDSLILELPLLRQKELMSAYPAIAFELLRAAGAVIAARNRASETRDAVATC